MKYILGIKVYPRVNDTWSQTFPITSILPPNDVDPVVFTNGKSLPTPNFSIIGYLFSFGTISNSAPFMEKTKMDTKESTSTGIGGLAKTKDFSFTLVGQDVDVIQFLGCTIEVIKYNLDDDTETIKFKGQISNVKKDLNSQIKYTVRGVLSSADKVLEDEIMLGACKYVKLEKKTSSSGDTTLEVPVIDGEVTGLAIKDKDIEVYYPITSEFSVNSDNELDFSRIGSEVNLLEIPAYTDGRKIAGNFNNIILIDDYSYVEITFTYDVAPEYLTKFDEPKLKYFKHSKISDRVFLYYCKADAAYPPILEEIFNIGYMYWGTTIVELNTIIRRYENYTPNTIPFYAGTVTTMLESIKSLNDLPQQRSHPSILINKDGKVYFKSTEKELQILSSVSTEDGTYIQLEEGVTEDDIIDGVTILGKTGRVDYLDYLISTRDMKPQQSTIGLDARAYENKNDYSWEIKHTETNGVKTSKVDSGIGFLNPSPEYDGDRQWVVSGDGFILNQFANVDTSILGINLPDLNGNIQFIQTKAYGKLIVISGETNVQIGMVEASYDPPSMGFSVGSLKSHLSATAGESDFGSFTSREAITEGDYKKFREEFKAYISITSRRVEEMSAKGSLSIENFSVDIGLSASVKDNDIYARVCPKTEIILDTFLDHIDGAFNYAMYFVDGNNLLLLIEYGMYVYRISEDTIFNIGSGGWSTPSQDAFLFKDNITNNLIYYSPTKSQWVVFDGSSIYIEDVDSSVLRYRLVTPQTEVGGKILIENKAVVINSGLDLWSISTMSFVGNPVGIIYTLLSKYLNISDTEINLPNFSTVADARRDFKFSLEKTKGKSVNALISSIAQQCGLFVFESQDGKINLLPLDPPKDFQNLPQLTREDGKTEFIAEEFLSLDYLISEMNIEYSKDETIESSELNQDYFESSKSYLNTNTISVKLKTKDLQDRVSALEIGRIKQIFHSYPSRNLTIFSLPNDLDIGDWFTLSDDLGIITARNVYLVISVYEDLNRNEKKIKCFEFSWDKLNEQIYEVPTETINENYNETITDVNIIEEVPNVN